MKRILAIGLASIFITACGGNNQEKNLTGVYVRETKDEYAKVNDTLHITRAATSSDAVYKVVKGTETEHFKMLEGMTSPKEYSRNEWTGKYNKEDNSFMLEEKGITYAVDLEKGLLTNGKVTYSKIE